MVTVQNQTQLLPIVILRKKKKDLYIKYWYRRPNEVFCLVNACLVSANTILLYKTVFSSLL